MNTVGIKELKNRLTHYIRLAKSGEDIIVTDRSKPIALIQKIEMVKEPRSEEAILARLAVEGSLTLAKKGAMTRFKPIRIKGRSASEMIVEDRRSSRF
jgi:prevent-host-death family protein